MLPITLQNFYLKTLDYLTLWKSLTYSQASVILLTLPTHHERVWGKGGILLFLFCIQRSTSFQRTSTSTSFQNFLSKSNKHPLFQTQAHGCLHLKVLQFTIFHRCRGMLKSIDYLWLFLVRHQLKYSVISWSSHGLRLK
jgi:hypothetical protein